MTTPLERSYSYCKAIARKQAKNFYYSFLLLPAPKRDAMCAIYAFMRYCDDLSDEPGARVEAIERWRAEADAAFEGRFGESPLWPAFCDTVARYQIPHRYFHEMIDGVSSDLERVNFRTFEELYRYCYQVASVVGLTIVHIFGFESPKALELAEKSGIAFQLTNILRDVREDSERGRVYLPQEDLDRFGVAELEPSDEFRRLMRFEAARARQFYNESAALVEMVDASSRSSLWALREVYSQLLERIERSNYDVLRRRIRLPGPQKLWIVVRAAVSMLT